jgi:hypothetical protein
MPHHQHGDFRIHMVNSFQAMPGFPKDFGYADSTLPDGYGISNTVQQLITIPLECSFQSSR